MSDYYAMRLGEALYEVYPAEVVTNKMQREALTCVKCKTFNGAKDTVVRWIAGDLYELHRELMRWSESIETKGQRIDEWFHKEFLQKDSE